MKPVHTSLLAAATCAALALTLSACGGNSARTAHKNAAGEVRRSRSWSAASTSRSTCR